MEGIKKNKLLHIYIRYLVTGLVIACVISVLWDCYIQRLRWIVGVEKISFLQGHVMVLIFVITLLIVNGHFYRGHLKQGLYLLQKEVEMVSREEFHFDCTKQGLDQISTICNGVDGMRQKIIEARMGNWDLLKEQKELNAAFAHDIRNPLTVMNGYIQMLELAVEDGSLSEEELVRMLGLVGKQIKRLELFSYTMQKMQSIDAILLEKKKIAYEKLGRDVEEHCFAYGIESIYIEQPIENIERAGSSIYCDISILFQILDNVVSNAMRYAKQKVGVEVRKEGKKLVIVVQDDGCGFSDELLEKATRPYFSTDKEHMGMGLTICKGLSVKHGGELRIDNAKCGGAMVTFVLNVDKI